MQIKVHGDAVLASIIVCYMLLNIHYSEVDMYNSRNSLARAKGVNALHGSALERIVTLYYIVIVVKY